MGKENRSAEMLCRRIADDMKEEEELLLSWRHHLHRHPELSCQETETAGFIHNTLHQAGIPSKPCAKTGVIARIEGRSAGRTVLLRADIDALALQETTGLSFGSEKNGVMHACGHDAHTACLLMAAKWLNAHRDQFDGSVLLIFQPGEEIGYGAAAMLEEYPDLSADFCFGLHVQSYVPSGSVMTAPGFNNAAVDQFRIEISGQSAHIARKQMGIDAGRAAAFLYEQICQIADGQDEQPFPALMGLGSIHSGTGYNIISGSAVLEGTLRTFDSSTRGELIRQLETLCMHADEKFKTETILKIRSNTSALINDEKACRLLYPYAKAIFESGKVITKRKPAFEGDDMARFLERIPGCYAYLGTANPSVPDTLRTPHDSSFQIDETALVHGAALYAAAALCFLQTPSEHDHIPSDEFRIE